MSPTSYKLSSHAILRILKKYTDENHRLRQKEILDLLERETTITHAYFHKNHKKKRIALTFLINDGNTFCRNDHVLFFLM